jgi:hypothetical protein
VNGFRWTGIGVVALLAGSSPVWAAAELHSYSLINASASRIDFADQKAQLGKNGFVNFSILTVLATGKVAYSISEVSMNCSSSQISTVSNTNYAANGTLLPADAVDTSVQLIKQGTLGQSLQLVVCVGVDPYPRSKAVNGVAAAVAKAHELLAAQAAGGSPDK